METARIKQTEKLFIISIAATFLAHAKQMLANYLFQFFVFAKSRYKPNWVAVGIKQRRLNTLDRTQVTKTRPQYALMAIR